MGAFWVRVWANVSSFFTGIWDGIVSFVSGAINRVLAAINYLAQVPGRVSSWFQGVLSGIVSAFNSAVAFVASIPGRILAALGNLGNMLFNAGRSIINGLVNGIQSAVGDVTNAVSNVLSAARNLLPFSPAKEGPFSGKGWTLYSGQSITSALADGMLSQLGTVRDAALSVTNAAYISPSFAGSPSASGPGGGFSATAGSSSTVADLLRQLIAATREVGPQVGVAVNGAGRSLAQAGRGI